MGSGNNQDGLTAAYIDQTAVIRVEGRGSFRIGSPMKQFVHQVVESGAVNRILIDMSDCIGMDSTFMGVLAGLSGFIKEKPDVSLKLINLSEKNQNLLITLGVDRVVDYSLSATDGEETLVAGQGGNLQPLEAGFSDKLEAAKTTLEAHETLANINPENQVRFRSVLELLQSDVRNLSHP
jgi:anti-anti-sigma regulatory factor